MTNVYEDKEGNQAAYANNYMEDSMEASAAEDAKAWIQEIRAALPKKSLIKIIGGGLCALALVAAGTNTAMNHYGDWVIDDEWQKMDRYASGIG